MKKRVLLVASIFAATFTFAQDGAELTSKKGETILPEAGDYAIGFNAAPFLNYAGNLFSSAGSFGFNPAAGSSKHNNLGSIHIARTISNFL